ncbi:MAG: FHA domain-containing protein [Lachnospiraceae bacterium]|nr:FHA domain-containing protein [Lachnospiraceae bacterium]MDY4970456.1 FHA domain-containing protein [Lachnospiraceae bacterium]
MRVFMNFAGILLICLLAALAVFAYRFFINSDPDRLENDPDVDQETLEKERKKTIVPDFLQGKGKKTDEQETVLINMPVLSWKYPGKGWENKELTRVHTTIGRGADCDIVINHPTVSVRHAEIIMKLRKINAEKKGARYFLLKNHSKENPVSFLNAEGGKDDWRDIISSIPLTYSENAFFLGLVEMRITFPEKKRVLSEGPDLSEMGTWKNRQTEGQRDTQTAEPAEENRKTQDTPEVIADPEIVRAQRKVIRRSPRSGNRI